MSRMTGSCSGYEGQASHRSIHIRDARSDITMRDLALFLPKFFEISNQAACLRRDTRSHR